MRTPLASPYDCIDKTQISQHWRNLRSSRNRNPKTGLQQDCGEGAKKATPTHGIHICVLACLHICVLPDTDMKTCKHMRFPHPSACSSMSSHVLTGWTWNQCSRFKIRVFNALQTPFGPSKYTSLKTALHNATPNWKWRRYLKSSI